MVASNKSQRAKCVAVAVCAHLVVLAVVWVAQWVPLLASEGGPWSRSSCSQRPFLCTHPPMVILVGAVVLVAFSLGQRRFFMAAAIVAEAVVAVGALHFLAVALAWPVSYIALLANFLALATAVILIVLVTRFILPRDSGD